MTERDEVGRLPQRCRCGGVGELIAVYEMQNGVVDRAGWVAKCALCGASTVQHGKWKIAYADWMARRCPRTFVEDACE